MILSAQQISQAYKRGEIVIDPFDEGQVQAASYDLRVGEQGCTTSTKKLVNLKEHGFLLLQPGDFGVLTVLEELKLGPQYVGRFGLRSKYARKGLMATTGPQIDPGFHGRLIIGITNLTPRPVSIPYKDDFLTVEFHRLEEATTKPYDGPYQGKLCLGPEEIEVITESEGMALSEMLTSLRSLSQNVAALTGQFRTFEWVFGLGMGFLALIVGLVGIAVAFKK
jgi:dCTP deaminase